jgi:hypothetical protein
MYLETLLDNGILGSVPIWLFWAMAVIYAGRLFRSSNRLYAAVGGLSLALSLSSLFAGLTGQHFYPQEHTLGIWAAFFLALRVSVEEDRGCIVALSAEHSCNRPTLFDERGTTEASSVYSWKAETPRLQSQ